MQFPSKAVRSVAFGVVLLAVVVTVGAWYYARSPKHLFYPDAMEYATVARNMARGDGATSQALWVLRLAFTNEIPAAEIRRPLLLPFWISLWFRLVSSSDLVAIWASAFWWYVAIGLTFLIAWRRGTPELAFWSVLLLVFDGSFFRYSFCGLSEPLFAALLIPVFWILSGAEKTRQFLIAGALIGLGQWVRTNSFFFLLPALVFVPCKVREKTLIRILCLIAGFAVVVFPIAFRNFGVVGTFGLNPLYPYVALNSTPLVPAPHGMERSLEPIAPMSYFLAHPAALVSKWTSHFVSNFQSLSFSIYPLCIGILMMGYLALGKGGVARNRTPEQAVSPDKSHSPNAECPSAGVNPFGRTILFVLLSILISMVLLSIGEYEDIRFYVPFAPLLFVLTAQILWDAASGVSPWKARMLLGVLLCISLVSSLNHILSTEPNEGRNWYLERIAARVSTAVASDGVIVSDVPWVLGWRADRVSMWLPSKAQEMSAIEREIPVSAIVLTQGVQDSREFAPEWAAIHRGEYSLRGYQRTTWDDVPGVVLLDKTE